MSGSRTPLSRALVNRENREEEYPIRDLFPKRTERLLPALLAACLAAGCASAPAEKIPAPEKAVRIDNVGRLIGREWFWGVYIMGKRVGYSYMNIAPATSKRKVLRITSSLKLDLSVIGLGSKIEMSQVDYTKPDLTLLRSEFSQTQDGARKLVTARSTPGGVEVQTTLGKKTTWKERELGHSVYPSSVMNLLPIVRGLWVGGSYRYYIFQPESGAVRIVKQRVKSYEKIEEFEWPAFRLATKFKGQKTESWIDTRGNMLMEKGKLGIFKMLLILENP